MKFEMVRILFLVTLRFVVIQKFCFHSNVTLRLPKSLTKWI